MPRRIGFLWDKVYEERNCIYAEKVMIKNKRRRNRTAEHIKQNPETYGKALSRKLKDGTFEFHEYREAIITDSYKGKKRRLKIPCFEDQAAMQAWLNIAAPYIERRNYYYNCGSIPSAGQNRAVRALQKWLNTRKPVKYASVIDIKSFYDTCEHRLVIRGLYRIFKDRQFVGFAAKMMRAMSSDGVGLAIGYPVSHWFANVALMELDHELRRRFPDVKFVRYMDDVALAGNNKRHIRKALTYIDHYLAKSHMSLKHECQIHKIEDRGINFLSFKFNHHYTLLLKPLMYRMARKFRRAYKHLTLRLARGVISYKGILKYCNSYNFRKERVYPYVRFKKCRKLIARSEVNLCTSNI